MKNFKLDIIEFRLIDSHWVCTDPNKYAGFLSDFILNLGLDYIPDYLKFARFQLADGFSVWMYVDALRVKFKIFNKPTNFKFYGQNA